MKERGGGERMSLSSRSVKGRRYTYVAANLMERIACLRYSECV